MDDIYCNPSNENLQLFVQAASHLKKIGPSRPDQSPKGKEVWQLH